MEFETVVRFQPCVNSLCLTLFQLDSAPMNKARSIKKWFSQSDVKELDLSVVQYLWDELGRGLGARPYHQRWTPLILLWLNAARLQMLAERFPRRVEADILMCPHSFGHVVCFVDRN